MNTITTELEKLPENEFYDEKNRNQMNMKRLYLKLHNLMLNITQANEEIEYYDKIWGNQKEQNLHQVLYNEHLNNLSLILAHLEKKNIELEEKCLSLPRLDNAPSVLKSVVEELQSKFLEEKEKNKKIGLYIKKEYVNSKTEEIEKLRSEIKEANEGINRELEQIQEYENRETEIIQNISK